MEQRNENHKMVRPRRACSACSLRGICLPAGLAEEDLRKLEDLVETTGPLRSGDVLIRQGAPLRAMYAVRAGFLKSYAETETGDERVVGFHAPGELLGFDAIAGKRYQAYTAALGSALICRLPYARLTALSRAIPELQRQLLRLMSRDLTLSYANTANVDVEARMARFLISFGERVARCGHSSTRFILPMTRRDLAGYLRLAPESVSRVLRRFERRELIVLSRREVRLKNLRALESLARDRYPR